MKFSGCTLSLIFLLISCNKQDRGFNPQGGNIPPKYIKIVDGEFIPNNLTVAVGSSVLFTNTTSETHAIVSDDEYTIISPDMKPFSTFLFKKDTIGTFKYHCLQHPAVRGALTLRP